MSIFKSIIIPVAFSCLLGTGLQAQAIILKSGVRIEAGDFSVVDGRITRTITLSNGQKGQQTIAITDIEMMDWPEVQEVLEAEALFTQGKVKEGVEVLSKARNYFKPFQRVEGSPYQSVSFAYVEALDQAGDFDGLLRAIPDVEAMKWDDEKKLKLRIIKLNMERRTSSDQDAVLATAKSILNETDDSTVSARLWMTIADIHTHHKRFEEALMAYLHIPVFYGSQVTLVPQAELEAARTLAKMERFEDAVGFYQRIGEAYPGSETATQAKNEMLPINGLKNKPDSFAQPAAP